MRFGFNDFYPDPASLAHVPAMFGDMARVSPGQSFDFARAVGTLDDAGIKTLMVLGYGGRSIWQWAELVATLAARFKDDPRVAAFELGNEPNMARFNNGIAFTPDEAAWYTRVGYDQARRVGWEKPLLTAGPARIDGRDAWTSYLREMFKAGIPDDADLAHHPYPERGVPMLESIDFQIEVFRGVLKNRSDHGRLWATEIGWSSDESEQEQAHKLTRMVERCRQKRLQACIVFRYADGPATETDQYRTYGVTEYATYQPKRAWGALKEWYADV